MAVFSEAVQGGRVGDTHFLSGDVGVDSIHDVAVFNSAFLAGAEALAFGHIATGVQLADLEIPALIILHLGPADAEGGLDFHAN